MKGIAVDRTAPRSPEQNGPIERCGGIVTQMARTMLIDSGLPNELWPYAIDTAVYLLNRLIPIGQTKSPLQQWREALTLPNPVPSLKHVRIWGCLAYRHIPIEDRAKGQKWQHRAKVGHLIGYEGDHGHIYVIWHPETNKIHRTRDAVFHEGRNDYPGPAAGDDLSKPIGPQLPKEPRGPTMVIHRDSRKRNAGKNLPALPPPPDYTTGRIQTIDPDAELQKSIQLQIQGVDDHVQMTGDYTSNLGQTEEVYQSIEMDTPDPLALYADPAFTDAYTEEQPRRISSRSTKGKSPARLGDWQTAQAAVTREPYFNDNELDYGLALFAAPIPHKIKGHDVKIPTRYDQAIQSPQAAHWIAAMEDQIGKLTEKNTWEIVKRPPNVTPLPGKWVYDLKLDANGYISQYRARWVVCGNFQKIGRDFDTVHAPVSTESAIKLVLSLIAIWDLEWEQFDVTAAYLHAALGKRQIYMRQPIGFAVEGDWACQLRQALYGLRQSAYLWHQTFTEVIKKLGFTPLLEDPCVYMKGSRMFILLYVDDGIMAAESHSLLNEIKQGLKKHFGLKELGEPTRFLGCKVTRDRVKRTISLSQEPYIQKILHEAKMTDCRAVDLPMAPGWQPTEGADPINEFAYRQHTGRINWLSVKTRPDLTYGIGRLQSRSKPNTADLSATNEIYRYLKGHPNLAIELGASPNQKLVGYVDSSFQDRENGRSTEAYIFFFGGAPISWSSKAQPIVAPSSTIAEYVAFDGAAKEAMWLKRLTSALGIKDDSPVPIWTDSSNGLDILRKPGYRSTTKWIDNRYHFVKSAVEQGRINFHWISGAGNIADWLTKPLAKAGFEGFRAQVLVTT
jgi:hypothetical protein